MTALYNEIDPFAAAWLRELIAGGHIAPGIVVETSIEDLTPNDLKPFHQVHLFAGIGVWSYALRRIGWPDDRPIWTGSCPCQPFSAAGKGNGFADERHLWPHFFHLITQCRPAIVVGEQVASKDGLAWLDLVQADMEGAGHAFGAVDLCAAGVGAPHIRQRLWWVARRVADAYSSGQHAYVRSEQNNPVEDLRRGPVDGLVQPMARGYESQLGGMAGTVLCAASLMEHAPSNGREQWGSEPSGRGVASGCGDGGVDHHYHPRLEGQRNGHQAESGRFGEVRPVAEAGELGGLADCDSDEPREGRDCGSEKSQGLRAEPGGRCTTGGVADDLGTERPHGKPGKRTCDDAGGRVEGSTAPAGLCGDLRPGPTNGLWRDADWLFCRDGKFRPVEPGTFPLVNGASARVGRLRGYGNAIVAPVAEEFLRAALLDELVNSAV